MIQSSKAVFLSYASEDVGVAKGICDALRIAGIEVWFDLSELRGGDAWDQKIRQQIRDCALFVPIISEHTQARPEGYFRLEWELAVDRSHLMAAEKAFLVPVVVDATAEPEALVPAQFREVQWIRTQAGEVPAAFVERIAALLNQPVAHHEGSPERGANRPPTGRLPIVLIALAVAAVVGLVVATAMRGGWLWHKPVPKAEAGTAAASVVTTPPAITEKSIAVLPFVDMSEKKDQEYFSDGLSEELIDHLVHNAGLKVIARTSSFAFKGKNEDMRSIATKLGVANLLEGSVRKAGGELRITAQLIRASDGVHLWSEIYDRKLTDIFMVQDEISRTVAKALSVVLSMAPAVGVQTASKRAKDVEAYNLVLKGNYFYARGNKGDNSNAVDFYQQALKVDPHYALAWAKLARVYAWQGAGELTAAEAETKGREAAGRALALDPNCAEAYHARGELFRIIVGDWTAAQADYERAVALDPRGEVGETTQLISAFLKASLSGQFGEYIVLMRHYLERNPLDTTAIYDLAIAQQYAGRLDEAAATSRKLLELNPSAVGAAYLYGQTLLLMGKYSEALAAAEKESDESGRLEILACIYWALGRRAESDSALGALEKGFGDRDAYSIAQTHAYRGEADAAFYWLNRTDQQNRGYLEILKVDPLLRGLHGDPRFDALLRKAKVSV